MANLALRTSSISSPWSGLDSMNVRDPTPQRTRWLGLVARSLRAPLASRELCELSYGLAGPTSLILFCTLCIAFPPGQYTQPCAVWSNCWGTSRSRWDTPPLSSCRSNSSAARTYRMESIANTTRTLVYPSRCRYFYFAWIAPLLFSALQLLLVT